MKKCLTMVAVCLMAAPAMAGEISDPTLAALGLGEMQTMTDAEGLEVRGKDSSFSMAIGTSLLFGQLLDENTKNFIVGSDVNMVSANSQSTEAGTASTSGKNHVSNLNLLLLTQGGVQLELLGQAGGTGIASGGFGNITPNLTLP